MRTGSWNALEALGEVSPPAAVLAEWQHLVGAEFPLIRHFLQPTRKVAQSYPCLGEWECGCRHEVVPFAADRWLARCTCDQSGCVAPSLSAHDLIIYELDATRFGSAVAAALGFDPPEHSTQLHAAPKIWPAGIHAVTQSPVYLALAPSETLMLSNLVGLTGTRSEPFILLAPTGRYRTELVMSLLGRFHCPFLPLAACIAMHGPGRFRATASIQPILDRFAAGLAAGNGLVKTVERIDRNIEAVARNQYELRKENEELRRLNKEGYFNFAVRVKGEDFLAFAVIMALGNRKAAADHLKIPHRTFYNRVDQWASRGRDYQLMRRYLEWRKRSSRHLTVELNPSLQSGEAGDRPENPETLAEVLTEIQAADGQSYPELLADVLQALERQNAGNWMKVRQELVELIKEDTMQ